MSAAAPRHVSFEDYLREEATREDKHEWCDGVVYAMSRGSIVHGRLTASLCRVLGNDLGAGCVVYSSETMLYIDAARLSTYADVVVVCGALETKVVKKDGRALGEAITNPVVLVEVLSESTERYDRDGKFQAYKQIASLEEYVLVAQDEPRIEVYRRAAGGAWSCDTAAAGQRILVHGAPIAVDEVYRS